MRIDAAVSVRAFLDAVRLSSHCNRVWGVMACGLVCGVAGADQGRGRSRRPGVCVARWRVLRTLVRNIKKWTHVLTLRWRLPRVEEEGLHPLAPPGPVAPTHDTNATAA